MDKEKMLIRIEEKSIFKKVNNLIKKVFFPKNEKGIEPHIQNNSFLSEIKESGRILKIQKSFESGELKESGLTEIEKNNLTKLYTKQIEELKQEIQNYDKTLQTYKEKILVIKRKINN